MLDLFFNFRCYHRFIGSILLLVSFVATPLHGIEYWASPSERPKHFEHEWIVRYINSINEETEIGEVIDFLVFARGALTARGYSCPSLMELAIRMKEYLEGQGMDIDEEEIQNVYEEIYRREQLTSPVSFTLASLDSSKISFELCKHKEKKKKKELKMKSKGICGFIKCLAGGLICIIPVPAVQAIGAGLVLNGINDIIDDARETGDENERLQKMEEQRRQEAFLFNHQ